MGIEHRRDQAVPEPQVGKEFSYQASGMVFFNISPAAVHA
jgi:hypothetical protein